MRIIRHIESQFTWEASSEAMPDWMQKAELFLEDAIVRILVPALEKALQGEITEMEVRLVPYLLTQD
jgi:hypothetical protein